MDELWDDYLQYLIWRCGLQSFVSYSRLFRILHHINFEYILKRDDNRDADGVDLRSNYAIPNCYILRHSSDLTEEFYDQKCSVLEMLIALAIRVDDEIIGDPSEEHPEEFFMEMIKNLGLDNFVDEYFNEKKVIDIVDVWLNREFHIDGRGSPFPTKYDHRDQRELEIWDQMNSYISENYS